MKVPERLQRILAEYRTLLENALGDELDAVVLYGSQARGEADDDSDIDVLCVMKHPFDYGELILRTSEASAEVSFRHNVVVSTAFAACAEYQTRQTPFLMNVRREGIAV